MRKFLPSVVAISILLTSCGGGSVASCDGTQSPIERFSLCLPDGWTQGTQPYGEAGNLITLITPAGSETGMMRLHIKKDPLQGPIESSMTFAERAVEFSRDTAPNYEAISTEVITVSGIETLLHVFKAAPEDGTETVQYYQYVITHGDIAYGFTAVMHPEATEEMLKELLEVFQSVEFS